jgi:hypothetical protein
VYPELPQRIPVYAPNGDRAGFASERQARALLLSGDATPLGTKSKVRSLRLLKQPNVARECPRRRPQRGDAHRRETYYNPRGTWTHDFLPDHTRAVFVRVLTDCLTAKTSRPAA